MTTELETQRITELHVRMDCNGCGNKIRKTLSAIDGVSEVYIDQATHKITVVGMADPESLVKAIRKTKRIPTIFSHTDSGAAAAVEAQPPPPADGEAEGAAQAASSPPAEPLAADAAPPAAAEEAAPAEAPAPENKEAKPAETPVARDATVVRTVHDYPYGYGHGSHRMHSEHWVRAKHPMDMHGVRYEASPYHANATTHSYVAEYGSGYGGFPVQEGRYYLPAEYYPARGKGDDRQITTIFSDENPNACNIA
ncbi:unnamed protein product [Miscanthus lutarioriparius]|uniref:HMA domain-containing protein n=1 Tax=Miscanthus lutarioriparius TaxID=422564 RepID=A0A811P8F5_9POAL|nr:unnamed protein product [Miscanthus lutarioriparius]